MRISLVDAAALAAGLLAALSLTGCSSQASSDPVTVTATATQTVQANTATEASTSIEDDLASPAAEESAEEDSETPMEFKTLGELKAAWFKLTESKCKWQTLESEYYGEPNYGECGGLTFQVFDNKDELVGYLSEIDSNLGPSADSIDCAYGPYWTVHADNTTDTDSDDDVLDFASATFSYSEYFGSPTPPSWNDLP